MKPLAVVLADSVATSAAVAETTALDPRRLALTERDFPASVKRMSAKENRSAPLPGGTGHAYTTTFQFRAGRRTAAVGTIVIAAPSAAVARRVYASAVAEAKQGAAAPLALPQLGDAQYRGLLDVRRQAEAPRGFWLITKGDRQ